MPKPTSGTRIIFLVDMQSFYASVEKADNPSLKDKPVVVAGDPERRSGIILAACPLAKKWGVETAESLWEAEQKCSHLVIVRPRMQRYIDVSIEITAILYTFTDLVEPYSIDEQFLDVTHSVHLFGTPYQTAQQIQKKILEKTGVYARVGIGPNKLLAKMANNLAKKSKEGIFTLNHDNIKEELWPLPVGQLFGVGSRMRKHLERMGIRTIGQLAQYPLPLLKKRWGINGEVLWRHANGLDDSPVSMKSHTKQKVIGHHMTLPRDYSTAGEIKTILLELSEEVGRRARQKGYIGGTVSTGLRGADYDVPTGFHRQIKLAEPTNYGLDIFRASCQLFERFWDGQPIRSAGVSLSNLQPVQPYQLSLFDSYVKKERLSLAMDQIKDRYGAQAILRAVSLTPAGQALIRAEKIGGHYK